MGAEFRSQRSRHPRHAHTRRLCWVWVEAPVPAWTTTGRLGGTSTSWEAARLLLLLPQLGSPQAGASPGPPSTAPLRPGSSSTQARARSPSPWGTGAGLRGPGTGLGWPPRSAATPRLGPGRLPCFRQVEVVVEQEVGPQAPAGWKPSDWDTPERQTASPSGLDMSPSQASNLQQLLFPTQHNLTETKPLFVCSLWTTKPLFFSSLEKKTQTLA